MKDCDNFEEWVRQRMRLFAEPPTTAVATSRHDVRRNLQAGSITPLEDVWATALDRSSARTGRRIKMFALVAMLLVAVGTAVFFQMSPFPQQAPEMAEERAQAPKGDLYSESPGRSPQQTMTVPDSTFTGRLLFEVAAIRQEAKPLTYIRFQAEGQRFTSEGTSLAALIRYAYNVESFQVIEGPGWAHDRNIQFRIQAKAEMPASTGEIRQMLQSLLADRFKLGLIHQAKQTEGYILRVDRNGPKLKKTEEIGPTGCFPFPTRCTGTTMAGFAEYLSAIVFRMPVIDRTSLSGIFDLILEWRPDSSQFGGNGGAGFFAGSPSAPSIFTAVKDQLGLTLEPGMVAIDILVIDHAEMPSDN